MAKMHVNNRLAVTPTQNALTSSFQSMIDGLSPANNRWRIYELNLGADGAPNSTDCQMVWAVHRSTAAGTGVASTPLPVNPADTNSAIPTFKINDTIEPTITTPSAAMIGMWVLNQRASQRWVAAPEGELICAATTSFGLAVRVLSPTYTGNGGASCYFEVF